MQIYVNIFAGVSTFIEQLGTTEYKQTATCDGSINNIREDMETRAELLIAIMNAVNEASRVHVQCVLFGSEF